MSFPAGCLGDHAFPLLHAQDNRGKAENQLSPTSTGCVPLEQNGARWLGRVLPGCAAANAAHGLALGISECPQKGARWQPLSFTWHKMPYSSDGKVLVTRFL